MNVLYPEDEDEDVDEEGRPLTIGAALRVYHNMPETKKVYCPN